MNGESAPRSHVPSSGSAMFLWQYEFEQSLMNQQLQYQQQAKAMEVSIKEAAQQAAAGAAEVGKLLSRENDASTVDIMKELTSSSRRDIEGVESQVPPLTPEFFRSESILNSPIRLEEKGNEKRSHRSRSQGTGEMRSSKSEERRRKQRSRSRERRRRHRSRSSGRERRRRHRSRSSSRERRSRHRSRSQSRESRKQHSSRSRIREKRRHDSRRSSRRSRSQSRTRNKLQESCRSSESKRRRESDIFTSPPKGHNRDEFSFPRSPDSRSTSSHNRGKQRMKSKTVDKTKAVKGMGKLSWKVCSGHFDGGELEGGGEALQKMIAGVQGQQEVDHEAQ